MSGGAKERKEKRRRDVLLLCPYCSRRRSGGDSIVRDYWRKTQDSAPYSMLRSVFYTLFISSCVVFFSLAHQVVWTGLTRKSPENAWVAKVPTWPLTLVFLGQLAALAGGVYWVVNKGEWVKSSFGSD